RTREANPVDQRRVVERVRENRILGTGEGRDRTDIRLITTRKKEGSRHVEELRERRLETLVRFAVSAQQVRSTLPDPWAPASVDGRFHYVRVIREPQIVVAAKRQVFPPIDDDARSLCAFTRKTAPREPPSPDLGEPVCEKLEDHGGR